MRFLSYNKNLKENSKQLRKNSTIGEIILWKHLRAREMMGYQFNRQKPIDNYIVDFYCQALNLVIEIDGNYHNHDIDQVKDEERQQILESKKLNFLRFSEMEVRTNIVNVLWVIENYIISYQESNRQTVDKAKRVTKK